MHLIRWEGAGVGAAVRLVVLRLRPAVDRFRSAKQGLISKSQVLVLTNRFYFDGLRFISNGWLFQVLLKGVLCAPGMPWMRSCQEEGIAQGSLMWSAMDAFMSGKAFGSPRGRRFATFSRGRPCAFDALRFQQEIASASRNMRLHAPVESACLRQDCEQRKHANDCRITRVAELGNFKFPAQQRQRI